MKILTIALMILSTVFVVSAQNTSVYSSLDTKGCRTIEQSDEGGGWYRGECKGVGGYKLEVTEGDLRQSVNVVAPSGKISELEFGRVSSAFSSVGQKAEWRLKNGKPIALIVRYNASENPDDSTKLTSYLIVTKITDNEICITDVIKPSKNQNIEAQKAADSVAAKPCQSFE